MSRRSGYRESWPRDQRGRFLPRNRHRPPDWQVERHLPAVLWLGLGLVLGWLLAAVAFSQATAR